MTRHVLGTLQWPAGRTCLPPPSCHRGRETWRRTNGCSFAYSDDDRALLRAAFAAAEGLPADPATRAARPGVLSEAETRVTLRHAEAVRAFLAAEMIDPTSIDVIGFHGQTVIHRPDAHFTVQIGDGAALGRADRPAGGFRFPRRRCRGWRAGRAAGARSITARSSRRRGSTRQSSSSTSAALPTSPMSMTGRQSPSIPGRVMR